MEEKILCQDCENRPPAEAVWYVRFTDYWIKNFNMEKKYPLCTECLMEILSDRFMGGGGYTSDDILSIFAINPITSISAINPKLQRGYKYKSHTFRFLSKFRKNHN